MLTLVCVTEQHYVSIFCTCVWSVSKPLIFDTENREISGFQLRMRINTKSNCKQKWSEERIEMTFLLASHQSTYVPEKHSITYRPYTSTENWNVVFFCNANKVKAYPTQSSQHICPIQVRNCNVNVSKNLFSRNFNLNVTFQGYRASIDFL